MAERTSEDPGDDVLDYASRNTPRNPVSWLSIVLWTILGLIGVTLLIPVKAGSGPSQRVQCGANERQLVTYILNYAQRNGGRTPSSLQELRASLGKVPSSYQKILECPAGSTGYVYVGQGFNLRDAPKGTILLYEPPTNHRIAKLGKGAMNVAYIDGSVRFVEQPQADKIITELKAGHNPPREEMIK